jgi:hypothetical protein
MKTTTLTALLFGGLSIIGLSSCKKLSPAKQATNTNTSNQINTKTATTTANYDFNDSDLTSAGWTKVFDDEFTGDLSNWYAYTGGVQNELELNQPANATIVNGVLQITAKQETATGPTTIGSSSTKTFNYTSASIVSGATYSANSTTPKVRIVARVKLASGYGLTNLFYSYGLNWPTNGQINFFQVEGNDTKRYETNYFYGTQAGQNLVTNSMFFNPVDQDLSSSFHVFVTEWTQNSLNYYIDGQLVEQKSGGGYVPSLFGKAENLALSLPIGGLYYDSSFSASNVQTGTMYVDYVKVFTSK